MFKLKKITYKAFYDINELVARTSPMTTHYKSKNPIERIIWQQKKINIKKLLNQLQIKNIVDLGCGDGGFIDIIDKKIDYMGIDISPTQISRMENAIKNFGRKNARVQIGDILNSGIQENTYDAALMCDVIEHVLSPKKLFEEAKRIVRKDGYIIMSVPNEILWELTKCILLKFPLRSPDHLSAIFPKDIKDNFSNILKNINVPINISPYLSLINIYLVKNEK